MGNKNNESNNKQVSPTQAQQAQSGGQPIPQPLKHSLETEFGTDFSDIRIHTGQNAAQLTKMVNAEAFTIGQHIFFDSGKFQPHSNEGKRLLAHELTHVVQQRSGQTKKPND